MFILYDYYMFILLLWVDLIETAISASTTSSTPQNRIKRNKRTVTNKHRNTQNAKWKQLIQWQTSTETHRNTKETPFVHAFTNHSNSKWLEKCERCTFEDGGSKELTNFTQQYQNLQVMRLSTKKRKQKQKCKRKKHLKPQPTDDITVKQTNKSKPSIIKLQNESQMQ